MSTSTRWLIGIGVALVALVVVAVAVALLARDRGPTYPENTPEGVVQRYLLALAGEDFETAYSYLSPEAQEACPQEQWVMQARWGHDLLQEQDVVLREVRHPTDDLVVVEVGFVSFDEPRPFPIPPERYTFREEFRLRQMGAEEWRLVQGTWPVTFCPPSQRGQPAEPPAVS